MSGYTISTHEPPNRKNKLVVWDWKPFKQKAAGEHYQRTYYADMGNDDWLAVCIERFRNSFEREIFRDFQSLPYGGVRVYGPKHNVSGFSERWEITFEANAEPICVGEPRSRGLLRLKEAAKILNVVESTFSLQVPVHQHGCRGVLIAPDAENPDLVERHRSRLFPRDLVIGVKRLREAGKLSLSKAFTWAARGKIDPETGGLVFSKVNANEGHCRIPSAV